MADKPTCCGGTGLMLVARPCPTHGKPLPSAQRIADLARSLMEHKAMLARAASVVEDAGEMATAREMRDMACDKRLLAEAGS